MHPGATAARARGCTRAAVPYRPFCAPGHPPGCSCLRRNGRGSSALDVWVRFAAGGCASAQGHAPLETVRSRAAHAARANLSSCRRLRARAMIISMPTPARSAISAARADWSLRNTLRSLGGGPGYHGPPSDHFDGRLFFNPDASAGRSFRDFLRWRRTANPKPWPRHIDNRARPALPASLEPGGVALTFVNHVTFLIQFPGLNVLTDPVYSERASPFRHMGPRRVRDPGLDFAELPPIHLVLVSHNHYDHLDIATLLRLEAAHAPHFITGLGNRAFLESFGLHSVAELDWWQSAQIAKAEVIMTPAQHWSTRGPGSRNRSLWGGFIVRAARTPGLFRGRHRLLETFQRHPRTLRPHGSGSAANWRLRAALVHA